MFFGGFGRNIYTNYMLFYPRFMFRFS